MTRTRFLVGLGAMIAASAALARPVLVAQATPSLGEVQVGRAVMANGQRLPAGTYTLRLTGERGRPVVGQATEESQWVEFRQGAAVRGRELATVLTSAEAKKVVKAGGLPAPGTTSAELLKGGDYLRVWINRGGTHYLLHLAVAPRS